MDLYKIQKFMRTQLGFALLWIIMLYIVGAAMFGPFNGFVLLVVLAVGPVAGGFMYDNFKNQGLIKEYTREQFYEARYFGKCLKNHHLPEDIKQYIAYAKHVEMLHSMTNNSSAAAVLFVALANIFLGLTSSSEHGISDMSLLMLAGGAFMLYIYWRSRRGIKDLTIAQALLAKEDVKNAPANAQ